MIYGLEDQTEEAQYLEIERSQKCLLFFSICWFLFLLLVLGQSTLIDVNDDFSVMAFLNMLSPDITRLGCFNVTAKLIVCYIKLN